jgi:hypothetical protein
MFEFVAQKFDKTIPMATLIAAPTIARLARVIDDASNP